MKINKHILLFLAAMLPSVAAMATLTEGFYRVSNLGSGRYLYVRDCTGSVSTTGTDFDAIELWSGVDKTYSDPSSIIYFKSIGNGVWDLLSQGTGVHQLVGYYVTITETSAGCMLYSSGQYLYEIGTSEFEPDQGVLGAGTSQDQPGRARYRVWPTHPITNTGDDFFGITPYLQQGGKYYTTFYAGFAYSPLDNVRSYSISQVDTEHAIAVYSPITGTVAKEQPVIVECPTAAPVTNRLNLTTSAGTSAAGNQLRGVYFCNGDRSGLGHPGTPAVVEFNPSTMRMLALDANNHLVMTNAPQNLETRTIYKKTIKNNKEVYAWMSAQCVPANQAYLSVSSTCPAVLRLMTDSEYNHYLDSIRPVITRDTTVGIIGSLTSDKLRSFPYTATLPVDTLISFRVATVIRTITTVAGKQVSVVRDTTWQGAAQPNTYVNRYNINQGFTLTGTYPIHLHTDAAGRYNFTHPSSDRLSISFPTLPDPVITRDSLYYHIGADVREAWIPMPNLQYSILLPIDSVSRFRFAKVVRTTSRTTIYDPVVTIDTLYLGATSEGESITRDHSTLNTQHSTLNFRLTADASGRYTLTLRSDSQLSVTFPDPAIPVITHDTVNYVLGDWTSGALQRMPSNAYALTLPIDSTVHFRFVKVVKTRTVIETRPAVITCDTLWLGASSENEPITRDHPSSYIHPHSAFNFRLTADASGRYTLGLISDTTLSVAFPAPAVPVIAYDTVNYIMGDWTSGALQRMPSNVYSLTLPIDSTVRFRFAKVVETRTVVDIRPAVLTYDTLYPGASSEDEPITRNHPTSIIHHPSSFSFMLKADASGRYTLGLTSDTTLSVTFPAPAVPGITYDTLYYMETAGSAEGMQPMSNRSYSLRLPIDSVLRFRFTRVVETRTIVETRPAEYEYDTVQLGAACEDEFITRDYPSSIIRHTSSFYFRLTADADGTFTISLPSDSLMEIAFPALSVPEVVSDTMYGWTTDSVLSPEDLMMLPASLDLAIDSVISFRVVRIVSTVTTVGSRIPVLTVDSSFLGAETAGFALTRDNTADGFQLSGTETMQLTADADGRYTLSMDADERLHIAYPALPVPVITCDTAHFITFDPESSHITLLPLPYTTRFSPDTVVEFLIASVEEKLTQVGSRQPVLSRDTTYWGADTWGTELFREADNRTRFCLTGEGLLILHADALGLYTFELQADHWLQITFPETRTGWEDISHSPTDDTAIYDLLGRRYTCGFDALPSGIYIIGHQKIFKQ